MCLTFSSFPLLSLLAGFWMVDPPANLLTTAVLHCPKISSFHPVLVSSQLLQFICSVDVFLGQMYTAAVTANHVGTPVLSLAARSRTLKDLQRSTRWFYILHRFCCLKTQLVIISTAWRSQFVTGFAIKFTASAPETQLFVSILAHVQWFFWKTYCRFWRSNLLVCTQCPSNEKL